LRALIFEKCDYWGDGKIIDSIINDSIIIDPITNEPALRQGKEAGRKAASAPAILALAESSEGSADEVESLLIEEVRRLGKTTMESWAIHAEEKTAQQFKADHPDARHGKKKR